MAHAKQDLIPSGNTGLTRTDGEGFPVGSRFLGIQNERVNKSVNRNMGPSRSGARAGSVPVVIITATSLAILLSLTLFYSSLGFSDNSKPVLTALNLFWQLIAT